MKTSGKKIKIGILGCGAIGSGIAQGVKRQLKDKCVLSALFDIDQKKSQRLAEKISTKRIAKKSFTELVQNCDFVVEAIAAKNTKDVIKRIIQAKKSTLVMSTGKLLNAHDIFRLADKNKCAIILPSGAIAGVDAIKAASSVGIKKITLTTRKPIKGLSQSRYLGKKGINLNKIKRDTVIFEGGVAQAVKYFPKNINVAATLAFASNAKDKLRIRIITSPKFRRNSHEIIAEGSFGRITTKTENVPCPSNLKTSYLAVLSGMQTLKEHFEGIKIGT